MLKFKPSNMLTKYLYAQPRNIYNIVGALMGYINVDPAFKTDGFEQAIQYVLKQGISKEELFAPFDPNVDFEDDRSKWNKDYYAFARVYLNNNFCEKRIAHVKAIARKLYPLESPIDQKEGSQIAEKKTQSQQTHTAIKNKPVINQTTIALIVILLLALVIGMIMAKR